jgi:hypothetical protein
MIKIYILAILYFIISSLCINAQGIINNTNHTCIIRKRIEQEKDYYSIYLFFSLIIGNNSALRSKSTNFLVL